MTALHSLPGLVSDAVQHRAEIVEHVSMARNTWRMRLRAPRIAELIRPGQFFMVREAEGTDPLLGRPFALYDIYEEDGRPAGIDFGYVVVGKLTSRMVHWRVGDPVELWGPLGNGFPEPGDGRLMLVAGGIGQTPFLAVAREALGLRQYGERRLSTRPRKLTLCYGARSREFLAGVEDFALPGLEVQLATDDGSQGHSGFVTDLLRQSLDGADRPDRVFCCGPEPMMHVVRDICLQAAIPCWLSLESPMACGFGACFSCVTRVREPDGSWDYKRACVEGPVFPAECLAFDGE